MWEYADKRYIEAFWGVSGESSARAFFVRVHFFFFFARMQQHMHACVDLYVPTGLEAGPMGGGGGF